MTAAALTSVITILLLPAHYFLEVKEPAPAH